MATRAIVVMAVVVNRRDLAIVNCERGPEIAAPRPASHRQFFAARHLRIRGRRHVVRRGGKSIGPSVGESLSHVDATLRTLAHSLVDGPLARLAEAGVRVHSVKAGCKDQRRDGENDFLVALFYEDVWDRAGSADLARCLLRNHKLFARAAKSDLWSVLGIDSRHWSGITSSLYNYDSLLPRDEQNELVELYEQERDEQGKSKRGIKRRSDAHEGPGREGRAKRTASASPTKPVDPAQFWPEESPDADGGGDDAEAQVKGKDNGAVRHDERLLTSARASVHTTTTPKKAKEPDPPRSTKTKPEQPPKRSVARDDGDSDSDTESEEEMLTLKLRSPSKSPVKGQGPGRPRDGEEPRTPAKIRSALQPRGPQGGTPGRDGAADSGKDEEKERERERGEAQGSARYEQQQQQQQRDRSAVLGLGLETRKLPQSRARETGNGPHEEGDKVSEGGAHEGATASTSSTKTHGHAHAHRPASARDMARSRGARGEGI